MRLSDEQVEQYNEEGYLIVEGALADSDLDPVIEEYEAHIERRARELLAEAKITELHEEAPFDRRLALIAGECAEIYTGLDIMQVRGKATFEFLANRNLLDVVEGIVGPEITCNPIQHIRAKLPSGLTPTGADGHVVAWHQDAGVTWEEADPFSILTVWIPVVPATEENGCLRIIPRTHGAGLREHVTRAGVGTVIVDEAMPKEEVLTLPMDKGSLLLMNKEIPHSSLHNNSDAIRWSMDLRYQETGAPTGRPFYPDFPVRSRADPDSVLIDHDEWCRRWETALTEARANKVRSHRWQQAPAATTPRDA